MLLLSCIKMVPPFELEGISLLLVAVANAFDIVFL